MDNIMATGCISNLFPSGPLFIFIWAPLILSITLSLNFFCKYRSAVHKDITFQCIHFLLFNQCYLVQFRCLIEQLSFGQSYLHKGQNYLSPLFEFPCPNHIIWIAVANIMSSAPILLPPRLFLFSLDDECPWVQRIAYILTFSHHNKPAKQARSY